MLLTIVPESANMLIFIPGARRGRHHPDPGPGLCSDYLVGTKVQADILLIKWLKDLDLIIPPQT